ncbi:hypothetical protein F4556_007150 [Kitasatospora gansuensis]|uniref:Uncharacterized protein n=1 Tax=Kitasatospora gansuensis TaxID=258050 RepID=A0A7W7WM06_9ACTN|nr:hypothetical protein [Kitasatospora gansuensis]MBB4951615.1 hypothetical protein [Kitasatospora gansuensis]
MIRSPAVRGRWRYSSTRSNASPARSTISSGRAPAAVLATATDFHLAYTAEGFTVLRR